MGKFIDITGQKFGELTAIKRDDITLSSGRVITGFLCRCSCGREKKVSPTQLRNGTIRSCGCRGKGTGSESYVTIKGREREDLTGRRFGRWTVLYMEEDRLDSIGRNHIMYRCKCDCGTERDLLAVYLKSKATSCGCIRKENSKKGNMHRKHSGFGTRLYRIWGGVYDRTHNPNSHEWMTYGGRGIKMCDEWIGEGAFIRFRDWALESGYADGLTIDRIDVDGDYCPENCRWVDVRTQQNNKRSNRKITVCGKTKTISDWTRQLGKSRTYYYRFSNEEIAEMIEAELEKK